MQLIGRGQRGERVLDVQRRLAALGHTIPTEERASFGPGTDEAVRGFQQARGLVVDGIVGPDTWRELVEASWRLGDRVLYLSGPHLRGDDVRELQDRLATFGFDAGRVDGIFGPQTAAAVREFQRNYGLPPDGIVGADTLRALAGLPPIAGSTPVGLLREREAMAARRPGLVGVRVVIDPGHGGDDPGHASPDGASEAEVCFALARRVEAALAAAGAHPFLTRRSESGPDDHERAALANALDADVFLALHLAGGEAGARGCAAYYFGHERYRSESGLRLAEILLEEVATLGLIDGRAHPKTFPVLRETRMTAVLLEPCYITNADEAKLLSDPAFLARLAGAIADGLRRYTRAPATAGA